MELQYFGGNCLKITTKNATIVVDDNLKQLGLKSITKPDYINLRTSRMIPPHEARFSAETPGEYEIAGVVVHGVPARAHSPPADGEPGKQPAVIYTIASDDIRLAIIGHIYPELSDDQLEQIGHVDVAVVPVGGNGYTLDGAGALKIIKQIEPKIVIPTHYGDKSLKYEVPQAELAEALKALAMEPSETTDKYKPKTADMSDTTHLVVLKRQ